MLKHAESTTLHSLMAGGHICMDSNHNEQCCSSVSMIQLQFSNQQLQVLLPFADNTALDCGHAKANQTHCDSLTSTKALGSNHCPTPLMISMPPREEQTGSKTKSQPATCYDSAQSSISCHLCQQTSIRPLTALAQTWTEFLTHEAAWRCSV